LADEKPSNYSRSPLLGRTVLHLVYESAAPNNRLQRTVMDEVPRHRRQRAAAEPERYADN
jgi:hypothetical protein